MTTYVNPFKDCDPRSVMLMRKVMEDHLLRIHRGLESQDGMELARLQGRAQLARSVLKDLGGDNLTDKEV